MLLSVFTEKYTEVQRKIITNAVIDKNGISMPVSIQWDTSATGTCISKEVVSKLGLIPIGKVNVHTPSGIGTMSQYIIDLIMNNEVIFQLVSDGFRDRKAGDRCADWYGYHLQRRLCHIQL